MANSLRKRLTGAAVAAMAIMLSGAAMAQGAPDISFQPKPKRVVEIAFALDATGSMARLIEGAKRKIWSIATAVADANPEAEIRMALVAYRDIGDEFVTRSFDLSPDIQTIYGHLLDLRANGGGDWPESVNEALDKTVTGLSWTQGGHVDRIVFLVGDAPAHMDYAQDRKFPEILKDARARGIRVNAVQAGAAQDTRRMWREIAQRGEGDYIAIPQDGGEITVVETPYDDEIIILQRRINETIVPYGDHRKQKATREKSERAMAAPKATATDMAGYLSRKAGSGKAVTGGGDLVADAAAEPGKLASMPDSELPPELAGKSAQERAAYLDKRRADRAEASKAMAELVTKRDAFVAQKRREAAAKGGSAKGDVFDEAVARTLKAQIGK